VSNIYINTGDTVDKWCAMEKGDIVRLDYVLWVIEGDNEEVYDTTMEDVAKEQGVHDPEREYRPMVTVVGEGRLIKGVDEALMEMAPGEEKEIEVPPEKGYGVRNPELIKVHSYREFEKNDITPRPGMEVVINNKKGKVLSVSPSRVVVDYNHPLAGRKLKFRLILREVVEDPVEKVRAIYEMVYGKGMDALEIEMTDDEIRITLPDVCKYDREWLQAKFSMVGEIRERVGNYTVTFVETFMKRPEKEEEPEEEGAEEKHEEETGEGQGESPESGEGEGE